MIVRERELSPPAPPVAPRTGPLVVGAECNFDVYPFFIPRTPPGKEPEVSYRTTFEAGGRRLVRTWTVRALKGVGLPGPLDQDVYVAVLELLAQRGGPDEAGELPFTFYELFEAMGIPKRNRGGDHYERAKRSLERIGSARITSERAFWSKRRDAYVSDSFNLWSLHLAEHLGRRGRGVEHNRLSFHSLFVESYAEGYVNRLDTGLYRSLKGPTAKRLYRLLCGVAEEGRWRIDLYALRDRIPLAPYRSPSKIREKLAGAHEQIAEKGFLADVAYETGAETGGIEVAYELASARGERPLEAEVAEDPEAAMALETLKAYRIKGSVAAPLVEEYGAKRCLYYAKALPDQPNIRSPAGWLREAIIHEYELDGTPGGRRSGDRRAKGSGAVIDAREGDYDGDF